MNYIEHPKYPCRYDNHESFLQYRTASFTDKAHMKSCVHINLIITPHPQEMYYP